MEHAAINDLIARAETVPGDLSRADWAALLAADRPDQRARLLAAAYRVKVREVGPVVQPRALIEFSNVCDCDCLYCGIRRGSRGLRRYALRPEEVAALAVAIRSRGYRSLVLQSGERRGEQFAAYVAEVLLALHAATDGALRVTLAAGAQSPETFVRWREAGAHRYLLRLETTDPELFARVHPADQPLAARRRALADLRAAGYQVGTGLLVGLPGQTVQVLAGDLLAVAAADVDMVGLGPFIPAPGTPLAAAPHRPARQLDLGLAMIACTRLLLPEVNIAAPTALEALDPQGRRLGLLAGANVVMPNHTPATYRAEYALYRGKAAAGTGPEGLEAMAAAIGETVAWGEPGDSPRWRRRSAAQP